MFRAVWVHGHAADRIAENGGVVRCGGVWLNGHGVAILGTVRDEYYMHLPLTGRPTFKISQALIYSIFGIY
jgi:hypothetical protein